jgi:hypothetical protein
MRRTSLQPQICARRGGRLAAIAAVLGLALLCTAAQAQWTWRDKDGRVTASDLPPPRDVPDKDILSRPAARPAAARPAPAASAPIPASAPGITGERELEARKKAAEAEKTAKIKAEEDKQNQLRAENCRRARAQVTALENGQRMARINDKGEREVLDDKGRAEETRRARAVIISDCR